MGNYTRRVLYLLMLTAVFTGMFLSSSCIIVEGSGSNKSEQKICNSLISDPLVSGLLFSGFAFPDSEILNICPSTQGISERKSEDKSKNGIKKNEEPENKEIKNKKQIEEIKDSNDKNESEKSLIAYVRLSPGTDVEILSCCSEVEEWDEASGFAAVRVKSESLEKLSSLDGIYSVRQAISPVIRKVDRGEKRASFSSRDSWKPGCVTGSGVKIGVISDGVEDLSGAVASGALPGNIHVLSPGKGKEGTVILEIVHETSPGAELYFHSAGGNKLEFNRAVDALIAKGCQIICDDVGWPDEPFFEDGIVASHIRDIIESQDILYVSAAGNDAERHYQGMFFDDGSGWHDFSSGTSTSRNIYMDIPPGEKITVVLQWNDPWNCAENDYDLFLYDCCNRKELSASEKVQNGTGAPLEYIQYTSGEETVKKVGISVKKHSGMDRVLEVYIYSNSSVKIYPDNLVEDDSVFGHPAVPGVICVGAVDSGGPENRGIASYSSRGPVSIYYPEHELRNKTDLSGPGSVRISGANETGSLFAGTSASAPSVAGIGAIIWSAYPEKSASEIREILCSSAEDLGEPGYDNIFGHGSVSYSAVYPLENPPSGNPAGNFLLEKSGIFPTKTSSSAESGGIFTLKLAMPLERICSLAKTPDGNK